MTTFGPTDFSALFGLETLRIQSRALSGSLERLATGRRINRASDDPAGTVLLSATTARRQAVEAQIGGLERTRLLNDTTSDAYTGVAERLIRLQGILTEAANTGARSEEELEALQIEADAILDSIDFTAETTTFNGIRVLNGEGILLGTTLETRLNAHTSALGTTSFQYLVEEAQGDPEGESFTPAQYASVDVALDDLRTGGLLNLVDGDVEGAQAVLDLALKRVVRASANTDDSGLSAQIAALSGELETLATIESEIGDTDYAAETSEFVRRQVLTEAATRVILLHREQSAKTTLGLLG